MDFFKKTNIVVLFSAILVRAFSEYLIPDLPTDKVYQLTSAASLADLKGISWAHADTTDLSKTVYERIGLWPPGYAFLSAPIIALGINWFSAALLVDIIAICIFFFCWMYLFSRIKEHISPYLPPTIFLYWAIAISPFRHLYSTDLIAVSFFSLGFCALMYSITSTTVSKNKIPIIAFCFYSPSLFHYGFYTVSFTLPLIFIFYALIANKKILKPALYTFVGTLFFIALQLCYLKIYVGDSYYLNEYHPNPIESLHCDNLKKFNPFIVNSFYDAFLLNRYLNPETSIAFYVIFSLVVVCLLFTTFKNLVFCKLKDFTPLNWLYVAGLVLIASKICLLITLSLRYPPEYNGWTYVKEPRYYSVAFIFIPLFLLLNLPSRNNKTILNSTLTITVLVSALLFSLMVNISLLRKYSISTPIINMCKYYHYSEKLYSFIKESKLGERKENLVFCNAHSNNYIYELFSMEGIRTIQFERLPDDIKTSQDVSLIIALDKNSREKIDEFLKKFKSKKLLDLQNLSAEIWEVRIQKNI